MEKVNNNIFKRDFKTVLQEFIAITAIGASTLRGQEGLVITPTRDFLKIINLNDFSRGSNNTTFANVLDEHTERLLHVYNIKNRPWGTARKALNLFLRECYYNRFMFEEYKLGKIENYLEIPLDSAVAEGLKKESKKENIKLPCWPGLKHLTKEKSNDYQSFALNLSKVYNKPRVNLDIYLWLEYRQ